MVVSLQIYVHECNSGAAKPTNDLLVIYVVYQLLFVLFCSILALLRAKKKSIGNNNNNSHKQNFEGRTVYDRHIFELRDEQINTEIITVKYAAYTAVFYTALLSVVTQRPSSLSGEERCVTTLKTAVQQATYTVAKRWPEKFRLAGIRTLTSAILYSHILKQILYPLLIHYKCVCKLTHNAIRGKQKS